MRVISRRFMVNLGLGAVAGAALAGGAAAQPMGPGGGGPGMMGRGRGGMGRHFGDQAAYLDGVKAELAITEAQAAAWKTYADVAATAGTQMQALHQSMWEAMGTATWEERRDMMNRSFQARQQIFQSVQDAAQALLPSLSDRQKGMAEYILPGLARRGPGRRGGR